MSLDGIPTETLLAWLSPPARRQYLDKMLAQDFSLFLRKVFETVSPGDYLGDVIGDMNRRRGTILEQVERGTNTAVVATIPLSEMFGYIGQLRSMSSGRASFTMEFSHYDPVPKNKADEVIEEVEKRRKALQG